MRMLPLIPWVDGVIITITMDESTSTYSLVSILVDYGCGLLLNRYHVVTRLFIKLKRWELKKENVSLKKPTATRGVLWSRRSQPAANEERATHALGVGRSADGLVDRRDDFLQGAPRCICNPSVKSCRCPVGRSA
nr:uncharacterized protein LOC126532988 [Dermacentor andersoni]